MEYEIRPPFFLFSRESCANLQVAGRRWPETFTADCAPAEGHNACIKPLASHLIEMRGSFDRGAAIARIQSVIEKTRGSVGRSVGRPVFIFVSPLGPELDAEPRSRSLGIICISLVSY